MNNNLSKLFKQAYSHPKTGLSDEIWRNIELRQNQTLKLKYISYGFTSIISLFGFILVALSVKENFVSSGFSEYFSLAFSDGSMLSMYWKEYLLSLAESIPVASIGSLSFLLFLMLTSIRKSVHFYKNQLIKI